MVQPDNRQKISCATPYLKGNGIGDIERYCEKVRNRNVSKMDKIIEKVIVEVSKDGLFSAYMPSDEYGFGLAGYGETEKEAIEDFYASVSEMRELEESDGRTFPDFKFVFERAYAEYAQPQTTCSSVAEDPAGYNADE